MFRNVTLLETHVSGRQSWRLLDPDGRTIPAFDVFAKTLERRSVNTRKSYLRWLAEFFDFLFEAAAWSADGEVVSQDTLIAIIEAYDDYLVLGSESGNPIAQRISQTMPSSRISKTSSGTKHAAIRKFLKLSERIRIQMLELTNAGFQSGNVSQQKLITGLGDRREPSACERQSMVRNSILAGCISRGPQLIEEGVLPTSTPDLTYDHERAFPFDKVRNVLDELTTYRDKALYALCAASGCRVSEALQLLWDDIDTTTQKVRLIDPKSRPHSPSYLALKPSERDHLVWKGRATPLTLLIEPFATAFFVALAAYLRYEYVPHGRHKFVFQYTHQGEAGQQKRICRLFLKTDITPHSARVSVVSHAISILPADLIGRYWTGQTEATVYHYVVPDEGEIDAEQQRQNLHLRQRGYDKGYEAMLTASPGRTSPFIKADDVNSRLSKSLQANIEETISLYGCVSLSLNGNTKTGLDVLRETRAVGIVATKTELCPYGSQCPPEVVVALNGFRRCGPCHFAVRSIDHLPAITAKIRQVLEGLTEIEARLDTDDSDSLTTDEWDALAKNRDVLAEDLAAWQMAAEVLEVMRQRLAAGNSTKKWHVQRPEIIEQDLKRALFPSETTDYLLARLHESEAFPLLESPQIRAKFDLLRRNLLANTGNIREALRLEQPTNPAAECLGLIRSIAAANQLGIEDIRQMMETGDIGAVPARTIRMLPLEESR